MDTVAILSCLKITLNNLNVCTRYQNSTGEL